MTPLDVALSSARDAACASSVALAVSPAAAASRNRRIEVRRADLVALLRRRAFSFVLIRLSWDLMFATGAAFRRVFLVGFAVTGARATVQVTSGGIEGQIKPAGPFVKHDMMACRVQSYFSRNES